MPCQPYSVLRDSRKCPPESHKLFSVTFGDFGSAVSYTAAVKPQVLMVEEVMGFDKPSKQGFTHKRRFMDEILAIPSEAGDRSHFAGGISITMTPELFMPATRSR
jgi:hypothetical protein